MPGGILTPLAAKASLSDIGLHLDDGTSFTEWQDIGRALGHYERSIMWAIGDWWAFGERKYGERAAVVRSSEWQGPSYQTCRDAAWVSRRFEMSRRRDNVSWSHHQEVAALPDAAADNLLRAAAASGWSKRVLRTEVRRISNAAAAGVVAQADTCEISDLARAAAAGLRFGTIYADPPWLYGNQATRAATGNHYGGMTVEEIAALPVRDLVADSAHLHLWTTNAFLPASFSIMEAWGFEYRSVFVWVKPQLGIGNYWRVSHEFLLLGKRGSAPFLDHNLKSWAEFDRGVHSAKPEQIRQMIERASPGPRLELFARRFAPGWAAWGNEIERSMFDHAVGAVA